MEMWEEMVAAVWREESEMEKRLSHPSWPRGNGTIRCRKCPLVNTKGIFNKKNPQINRQGFLLEKDTTISCLIVRPAQMQVISVRNLAKELIGHLL